MGPSGSPTEAVWAAAEAATARGQHLALSTARAAFGPTLEYAERLDPAGWHVFHAGAALVHTNTNEVREQPLHPDTVDIATKASRTRDWTLEYYGARDYAVSDGSPLALEHADLLGVPHRLGDAADIPTAIVRLQFVVPELSAPDVMAAMEPHAHASSATSPVMPGAVFISVTPPGVTKASAIAEIAHTLDIAMADVMMVGDGQNDLDAIDAVGHGVAMGNAEPAVKAAARHLVAPVADDGLVEALELAAQLQANQPRRAG